jgi:hypothetical protein
MLETELGPGVPRSSAKNKVVNFATKPPISYTISDVPVESCNRTGSVTCEVGGFKSVVSK